MNAKRIVPYGDRMVQEALEEIAFKMEILALRQTERDLIEAEIADIGALKNQLEAVKC